MSTEMTQTFNVGCFRFSKNVAAMGEFLTLLGARVVQRSESGDGWMVLLTSSGEVSLHAAATANSPKQGGETELYLSTDDLDLAKEQLASRGVDISIWDESFGRQAKVDLPADTGVWLDEKGDGYGYVNLDVADPGPLQLTVVKFSDDFGRDKEFFAAFGLGPVGHADEWWTALEGAGAGTIGLHHTDAARPGADVELSFTTTEALAEVRDRLLDAGHPDPRLELLEGLGEVLMVTDPDGVAIQVHSAR